MKNKTLSNQPLKGMADLFPEQLEKHLYFEKKITSTLNSFCYSPYETPVLEPIEIYLNKSSQELLEKQSYSFEDRGGRKLILRPELTASLARMVSRMLSFPENSLPLKLFSLPKCYRYERPQKGRMREFRQLNVDILSQDKNGLLFKNIEIFYLIEKIFQSFEVNSNQYEIFYSDRYWLKKILTENHFSPEEIQHVYFLLDHKNKKTEVQFQQELEEKFKSEKIFFIQKLVSIFSPREIKVTKDEKIEEFYLLEDYLSQNFSNIHFSPTIVRGLEYYTGVVFEVFSKENEIKRAIFGGGRYDHLLEDYLPKKKSDESITGIGFGVGVDIFILFLEHLNLLPNLSKNNKKIYLGLLSEKKEQSQIKKFFSLKEKLLAEGYQIFFAENNRVKNHFKKAEKKQCSFICFFGEEEQETQKVVIKNLETKEEKELFF